MCSTSLLIDQLTHALLIAIAFIAVLGIALTLDRAAHWAAGHGAGMTTVWMLERAAFCLLGFDLLCLLVAAFNYATRFAQACLLPLF